MIRILSRGILWLCGWKIVGRIPGEKKYVVVAAPHTSNWDFVWGQLFYFAAGISARIMIKKELFYFPLGSLLQMLGGIAVDRQEKTDIVEQMVREFEKHESFILVLAPEGTRRRVTEWKTGFHRIATGAGVPIVLGFIDYGEKLIGTAGMFYPSGDAEDDVRRIKKFYKNLTAKYPANFSTGNTF